jgi:hypothetical protein
MCEVREATSTACSEAARTDVARGAKRIAPHLPDIRTPCIPFMADHPFGTCLQKNLDLSHRSGFVVNSHFHGALIFPISRPEIPACAACFSDSPVVAKPVYNT